jgi:dihydroorotate dehydrogenase
MTHNYYHLLTKVLFRFDPERIHAYTLHAVNTLYRFPFSSNLLQRLFVMQHPALRTTVNGIAFPNPIGLAAGYDKDGIAVNALSQLGFGFLEVGTVTPSAQTGNQKPRIFRLPTQQALLNHVGFANQGAAALALTARSWQSQLPIGINIGKQRHTTIDHAVDDYRYCFKLLAANASYVALNISSPNTPQLRQLQTPDLLTQLLQAITPLRQLSPNRYVPIWIKISPDETDATLAQLAALCLRFKVDGIIAVNTSRKHSASTAHTRGGISGKPLAPQAEHTLRTLYAATQGNIPLISVGGIDNATTAYQRLQAGASLLQIYTGLVYQGPTLPARLAAGIVHNLHLAGYTNINQIKHTP